MNQVLEKTKLRKLEFGENPKDGERVIRVLSTSGDDRYAWDKRFLDQVHEARDEFYAMRKKGYAAYLPGKGGGRGQLITEFDPDAEEILFVGPVQGG